MSQNNVVSFNSILVNYMDTNTGIFVGSNSQSYWQTSNNNKSGFGSVTGTGNVVSRAVNIFMDNDLIDTPIFVRGDNIKAIEGKDKSDKNDNILIYGGRKNSQKC